MATIRALVRIFVASGITAAAVYGAGIPFGHRSGDVVLVARLVAQVAVGLVSYLILARSMRIRELRPVIRLVRRMAGAR